MTDVLDTPAPATTARSTPGKRFGYGVAVAVNAGLIYVAHHLVAWGWPRFVTDQFDQLVPIITLSLVASIVANVVFFVYDDPWFKSLANAIIAAISLVVSLRTLQVFPFDFSTYDHDWSGLLRVLIVVAMVGAAIGCIVETIRFLTWPLRRQIDQA